MQSDEEGTGMPKKGHSEEQILRALRRLGFEEVRASGSHRILRNAEGKRITVPYHTGQVLHPKLL